MVARTLRSLPPLPLETRRPGRAAWSCTRASRAPPMRVVERGAFMVEVLRHDGRRLVLDVLGPGDGVGGAGALARAEPAGARQRLAGDRASARPGLLRDGDAGTRRPGLLARRAERAARLAADLAWFDVSTRLLARLHVLAERFGRPVPGGLAIGLRLTHDDLADLCGTSSRESVTRAMGRLVAAGPRRGASSAGASSCVTGSFGRRSSCNRIRLHEPQ